MDLNWVISIVYLITWLIFSLFASRRENEARVHWRQNSGFNGDPERHYEEIDVNGEAVDNRNDDTDGKNSCAIRENPGPQHGGANRNTIEEEKHMSTQSPFPNTKRGAEENDDVCSASGVHKPVQCTDDENSKDA